MKRFDGEPRRLFFGAVISGLAAIALGDSNGPQGGRDPVPMVVATANTGALEALPFLNVSAVERVDLTESAERLPGQTKTIHTRHIESGDYFAFFQTDTAQLSVGLSAVGYLVQRTEDGVSLVRASYDVDTGRFTYVGETPEPVVGKALVYNDPSDGEGLGVYVENDPIGSFVIATREPVL